MTPETLATPDAETLALLRELGLPAAEPRPGLLELGIELSRAGSSAVFHAYAGDAPEGVVSSDLQLPAGSHTIPARLYQPGSQSTAALPLVVFFHGGAWAMGDLDCYDAFTRDVCALSGAMLLSVDYRLAPEHKYPSGLDDGLAAMRWADEYLARHGGAPLAVMGDSAGGNLAAVIARRLHAEQSIRLAAQFLLYPMLDVSKPHAAYPSRMQFGDGQYLLTRESIDAAMTWYLDGHGRPDDPDVSPLLAQDLSVLPETVLIVGGLDPLLDEARLYAARLAAAGVAARLECFESAIHAFLSFGVLEVAREGRRHLARELKRCLFT